MIDNPIEASHSDLLQVEVFATAIARFIETCDTPVTIGVQGDWGIGKTSLLNLLKVALQPRQGRRLRTPYIYVNTWQHAQFKQEEWLGIVMLNGIVDKLDREFPEATRTKVGAVRSVARTLGRFALGAANAGLKSRVGLDIKSGVDAVMNDDSDVPRMGELLEEYRSRFADMVNAVASGEDDRLVIMIDDLDRVTPIRAIELLEAIKNFLNVDKCVFVLAVDYGVIQQGVAQRLGAEAQRLHGKSYFDKIIQVPFNMPTTAFRMDRYILALLGWDLSGEKIAKIGDDLFLPAPTSESSQHVEFFVNITKTSVGQNPRSIKRVAAYAKLLRLVREESLKSRRSAEGPGASRRWDILTAKVLYALACLQIEWPELFRHLLQNPVPGMLQQYESWEFLSKLDEVRQMLPRYADHELLKASISGFVDELLHVVDQDGSGELNVEEFEVMWDILNDAGMVSQELPRANRMWDPLDKILSATARESRTVTEFLAALRDSNWTDPARCRVIPAGKRFVHVLWNSDSIGSIVSTGRDPLRLYIDADQGFGERAASSGFGDCVSGASTQHYGTGNWEINIESVLKSGRASEVLDQLLAARTEESAREDQQARA